MLIEVCGACLDDAKASCHGGTIIYCKIQYNFRTLLGVARLRDTPLYPDSVAGAACGLGATARAMQGGYQASSGNMRQLMHARQYGAEKPPRPDDGTT